MRLSKLRFLRDLYLVEIGPKLCTNINNAEVFITFCGKGSFRLFRIHSYMGLNVHILSLTTPRVGHSGIQQYDADASVASNDATIRVSAP